MAGDGKPPRTGARRGERRVARHAERDDFAPVAYLRLGLDTRVRDANLTAAAFFGRERDELIGTLLTTLVAPEARKALRAHLATCVARCARVESELVMRMPGRPAMTAQVTSVPSLDAAGRAVGCQTVLTDISSLRWSQDKLLFLNHASGLLGASFDVIGSLALIARHAVTTVAEICILDIVDGNGRLSRLAAAFSDAIKADSARSRAPAPSVHDGSALGRVLRTGAPLLFATLPPSRPGTAPGSEHDPLLAALKPKSLMYVPIGGRGGNVLGVMTFGMRGSGRRYSEADVATMRDLATHIAMAMESARLYREAQWAIAARQDVLSFVSHDLKNPLMGIMLTTETILRSAPSAERRRSAAQLRRIQHAAQQMRRMIDDLLDMSAVESGHLAVQLDVHDVAGLLEAAGEQFIPLAAARDLELVIAPPATPLAIVCDRLRLAQVFSHLVDNALKFTPPGGRISISARRSGDEAVFTVTDTGPGISAELQKAIFDRFVQASGAAAAGRGLGLYIARGLIAAQGGSIDVHSNDGAGATFSFTLPLAAAETSAVTTMAGAAITGAPPERSP